MYALSIKYNDHGPYTAVSAVRGGLAVHLYNSSKGFVYMRVSVRQNDTGQHDYWLKTIKPGDRLEFAYGYASASTVDNIAAIERQERINERYAVPPGLRLGFDLQGSAGREKVRLSHPAEGGFSFVLSNAPLDHARCYVMAGNEDENWNWSLADLYDGGWVKLEFVETAWNSPFPRIEKRPRQG